MGLVLTGAGASGRWMQGPWRSLLDVHPAGGRAPDVRAEGGRGSGRSAPRVPLIHTTDLYHPPQDPDDQIDLATVLALDEYDVQGVVLDISEKFLHPAPEGWDIARVPGFAPVARMEAITGRTIPVTQGPHEALSHTADACERSLEEEQAGVRMILELLEGSPEPVTVSVTGSPRALMAAYNRDPVLVRRKTGAVLLNAGSTGGPKVEWNVQLDPQAYVGLWRSDLPIHWFPPGTDSGAFDPSHERGTYYRARQAELFRDLSPALRSYFAEALAGGLPGASPQEAGGGQVDSVGRQEGSVRRQEDSRWRAILGQDRNLWSTASLVMGAGRVLAETGEGWRFLPVGEAGSDITWPWRLDPIRASVDEDGVVSWVVSEADTRRRIFGRRPGPEFGRAMTEAHNALLRGMGRPGS